MTTQCENQTCENQTCESQNSIDPFEQAEIQKLIDSETFINVFLGNGVKLVGTPKEQSDHAILLSQKTDELMLLKNAILFFCYHFFVVRSMKNEKRLPQNLCFGRCFRTIMFLCQ